MSNINLLHLQEIKILFILLSDINGSSQQKEKKNTKNTKQKVMPKNHFSTLIFKCLCCIEKHHKNLPKNFIKTAKISTFNRNFRFFNNLLSIRFTQEKFFYSIFGQNRSIPPLPHLTLASLAIYS